MLGDLRSANIDSDLAIITGWAILFAVVVFVSLLVALVESWRWKVNNPGRLGFKLGFFFIYSTLIVNGLLLFIFLLGSILAKEFFLVPLILLLVFVLGFCAANALQRQKWALVAMTLLSLNPLWIVINIFYLQNRWAEFGDETAENSINYGDDRRVGQTGNLPEHIAWGLTRNLRLAIFAAVAWALVVGVFAALFEPYGRYVGGDFTHLLAVMFLPNCAALALYWAYLRFVR